VQLQAFLQLVESSTQELLDNYQKKQDIINQTNVENLSAIENGCSMILGQADDTYRSLTDSVEDLASAVEEVLSAQERYIRERRDKEQKTLLSEVSVYDYLQRYRNFADTRFISVECSP
jgi:hypothetical protein